MAPKKKYHAKKGSKPSHQGGRDRPSGKGGGGGGGGGPRKKQYSSNKKFPLTTKRRGGPGMLLTCEAGREVQCCREGLLILQHYYEQQQKDKNKTDTTEAATPDTKTLTMDEEIAMLQQQGSATASSLSATANAPFAMYETGCRGTVFLICTLPDCALIPLSLLLQQRTSNAKRDNVDDEENQPPDDEDSVDEKSKQADENEEDANATKEAENEIPTTDSNKKRNVEESDSKDAIEKSSKKRKADDNNGTELSLKEQATLVATSSSTPPPWDPVATIQSIIRDLSPATAASSLSSDPPPSSRYVTRMIPMQATCYASVEEIEILGRALIQRYLQNVSPPSEGGGPQTFSIAIKRRICSNVTRDAIIDALASAVMNSGAPPAEKKDASPPLPPTTWKVDLKNADMIVQVEICKTLCGISVLSGEEHRTLYRNFNLIEIRTQDQPPTSSSTLPPSPSAST